MEERTKEMVMEADADMAEEAEALESKGEECLEKKHNKGAISIEVILILVVLIALVVIFKSQIVNLANTIWKGINSGASNLLS